MSEEKKPLIHVVGSVNLEERTGSFLYVTPANRLPELPGEAAQAGPAGPAGPHYELVVLDANGAELARTAAQVFVASDSETPTSGLIDQTIERVDGMAVLVLVTDGTEIARFEASSRPEPAATGVVLGPAMPSAESHRPMSLEDVPPLDPGATYTIEVRPEGDNRWQTIAIGVPKVELALDRNQFPNSETAEVRVRRTNGFEEEIVAQDTVVLAD